MNSIVAIAAMIQAPLAASLVQMAISRSRQYRRLLSPAVGRIVAAVVEHQQAVTGPFHCSLTARTGKRLCTVLGPLRPAPCGTR